MFQIRVGNKRRKHGLEAGRGRLGLRPVLLALEGRTLLSTFNVSSTADDGSIGTLRWAINQAKANNGADTITFSSLFNSPQTITLTSGPLQLTDEATTTIAGPGPDLLTVSGARLGAQVFEVTAGSMAAMSGLTITDGMANGFGGGVLNSGNLTLTNAVVRDNFASSVEGSSGGGGLAAVNEAMTTLIDCTISGNVAGANSNPSPGGGIYNGAYAKLTMTNCTISGNVASAAGGGIWNANYATLTGCTINNNSALYGGGLASDGTASLTDVTVSGNNTSRGGGGLISSGTLAMTGCSVKGNSSLYGGGLLADQGGDITLSDCTISGNSAATDGGGAANSFSTLALSNCTFSGNSAGGRGGGLVNGSASPVLARPTTTSSGARGAGPNQAPPISLTNCTVSGNSAYGGAGGVANYDTLSLSNTIVAENDGGDLAGSHTGSNNLIGGNPLLADLGDYGGPTATMALLPGSPAIGGGTSRAAPAFDQRGQPRSGHVDIGAFQSQGFTIMPVAGSYAPSTLVNQSFPKPLVFTVTANNPVEPVDGGIVQFTVAPAGGASATLSAATATISSGVASVTATANATIGRYGVNAATAGAGPGGLLLTNIEPPSLVVTTDLDEMDPTDGLTSLREAIAYADSLPGPSTITFDPAFFGAKPRTIRLTGGPLVLTDPATTTIVGPGARRLTIAGGPKSGVFDVEGGSLSLSGLTIAGGNADLGGGLQNDVGRLVLTQVVIRGNRAIVGGGLFNNGRTTLSGVMIRGNRAQLGSGMFNTRAATLLWRRSPAASRDRATSSSHFVVVSKGADLDPGGPSYRRFRLYHRIAILRGKANAASSLRPAVTLPPAPYLHGRP
jgi:hypothetical protein